MGIRSEAISRRCLSLISWVGSFLLGPLAVASFALSANAAETLTLSCYAQVYEAFRGEYLESFEKETQGALQRKSRAAHVVRIDDLGPGDPGYPYYEVFSLVTRGKPEGSVKKFVDHAFSDGARKIFAARGMKLIER